MRHRKAHLEAPEGCNWSEINREEVARGGKLRSIAPPRVSVPKCRFSGLAAALVPLILRQPGFRSGTQVRRMHPTRAGGISPIVTGGDVSEITGRPSVLIKQRVDKSSRFSDALVDQRDQSGPERSHGARASDHIWVAIDESYVSGGRIGIPGNVRNSAPNMPAGIRRRRNSRRTLVTGKRKHVADAASGCAFIVGEFVPHRFICDGVARRYQLCTSTGQHIGT